MVHVINMGVYSDQRKDANGAWLENNAGSLGPIGQSAAGIGFLLVNANSFRPAIQRMYQDAGADFPLNAGEIQAGKLAGPLSGSHCMPYRAIQADGGPKSSTKCPVSLFDIAQNTRTDLRFASSPAGGETAKSYFQRIATRYSDWGCTVNANGTITVKNWFYMVLNHEVTLEPGTESYSTAGAAGSAPTRNDQAPGAITSTNPLPDGTKSTAKSKAQYRVNFRNAYNNVIQWWDTAPITGSTKKGVPNLRGFVVILTAGGYDANGPWNQAADGTTNTPVSDWFPTIDTSAISDFPHKPQYTTLADAYDADGRALCMICGVDAYNRRPNADNGGGDFWDQFSNMFSPAHTVSKNDNRLFCIGEVGCWQGPAPNAQGNPWATQYPNIGQTKAQWVAAAQTEMQKSTWDDCEFVDWTDHQASWPSVSGGLTDVQHYELDSVTDDTDFSTPENFSGHESWNATDSLPSGTNATTNSGLAKFNGNPSSSLAAFADMFKLARFGGTTSGGGGASLDNTSSPVTASSSASALLKVTKRLVSVSVTANSSASASMLGAKPVIGSAAGTSTSAGSDSVSYAISSTATGTSSSSGTPVLLNKSVSAQADGTSTVSGVALATRSVSGSGTGSSSATSVDMLALRPVVGSLDGSSTGAGALSIAGPFAASADGASSSSGVLLGTKPASGTATGVSSAAAPLSGAKALVTITTGTSTAAGTQLIRDRAEQGSAAGSSTASALPLNVNRGVIGSADGSSTANAEVVPIKDLVGRIDGTSSSSGDLTSTTYMDGALAGSSSAAAALLGDKPDSGSADGNSDVVGTILLRAVAMVGQADGDSDVLGLVVGQSTLVASTSGSSSVSAVPTLMVGLAGSGGGTSQASAAMLRSSLLFASAGGSSDAIAIIAPDRGLIGQVDGSSSAEAVSRTTLQLSDGEADGDSDASGDMEKSYHLSSASAGGRSSASADMAISVPIEGIIEGMSSGFTRIHVYKGKPLPVEHASFADVGRIVLSGSRGH